MNFFCYFVHIIINLQLLKHVMQQCKYGTILACGLPVHLRYSMVGTDVNPVQIDEARLAGRRKYRIIVEES
jgi:hypothetical protein